MDILEQHVGIDVSKDHLDISIEGARAFRIPNTLSAVKDIARRLSSGSVVHLESSGGYERIAQSCLGGAGFEVRTHNPRKVRRLADARSKTAKTDAIDARHLAESGRLLVATPQKSSDRQALCDISRTIAALMKDTATNRKRLALPSLDERSQKALRRTIKFLEKQVLDLKKAFIEKVKQSELRERYELAQSVPGVGPELARVLTSELPEEIESLDRRRIASYAGLAPIDRASGKFKGTSHTGQGNSHLKQALYLPAVSLIRSSPWAKSVFERQRASGKHSLVALVAIMRRLLCQVIAVLRRRTPWTKTHPAHA